MICHEEYVGQTTNKFSTRWSSHSSDWNKPDCKNDKDQMALPRQYSVCHGIVNKPHLHETCTATFAQQSSFYSLDTCESKWFHKRDTKFNIRRMILPHVKQFLHLFALFFDVVWPISSPSELAVVNSRHSVQCLILKTLSTVWLPTFRTQPVLHTLPTLCLSHNGGVFACGVTRHLESDSFKVPMKALLFGKDVFSKVFICRSLCCDLYSF